MAISCFHEVCPSGPLVLVVVVGLMECPVRAGRHFGIVERPGIDVEVPGWFCVSVHWSTMFLVMDLCIRAVFALVSDWSVLRSAGPGCYFSLYFFLQMLGLLNGIVNVDCVSLNIEGAILHTRHCTVRPFQLPEPTT